MVFSKEDKIIIQNDSKEKGWSAYKIWKKHSSKNCAYTSTKRLLKCFKNSGTGQPRSVTTEENTNLIEKRIFFSRRISVHTPSTS